MFEGGVLSLTAELYIRCSGAWAGPALNLQPFCMRSSLAGPEWRDIDPLQFFPLLLTPVTPGDPQLSCLFIKHIACVWGVVGLACSQSMLLLLALHWGPAAVPSDPLPRLSPADALGRHFRKAPCLPGRGMREPQQSHPPTRCLLDSAHQSDISLDIFSS